MDDHAIGRSAIEAEYRERTARSAELAREARELFPSGLVHDSRRMSPHPFYVARAEGPRKWDVDGNEYIDYFGGHGALLLGHGHPAVLAAAHAQLDLGTHYGACHALEIEWGRRIASLVPCAERVRFTASGTEANLMALRLARAFTGRDKIVRFKGHFHGWQDHVAFGYESHFDGSASAGVLDGIADSVILADAADLEGAVRLLESRDDVAAVILEPTGGSFGALPLRTEMLAELREATAASGALLLFDEVVTGFRVAPGGAQAFYGVTPDLATFAKVVAGGLPGACVAGREAILELLDFEASAARGVEKIAHQGTFNANPVSAAAGIAALDAIVAEDACAVASRQAARLREGVNALLAEQGVPWACYGEHSGFYVYTNPDGLALDPTDFDPLSWTLESIKRAGASPAARKLRLALLDEGVDISGKPGGVVSCTHGDAEIDATVAAFGRSLARLRAEGELGAPARRAAPAALD